MKSFLFPLEVIIHFIYTDTIFAIIIIVVTCMARVLILVLLL